MDLRPVVRPSVRKRWLQKMGGLLAAGVLLAVPAFALGFADLKLFASADSEPSPAINSAATAEQDLSNRTSNAGSQLQETTILLNDWHYSWNKKATKQTKQIKRTKETKRTKVVKKTRRTRHASTHRARS